MSFGQNESENDVEDVSVKKMYWITESCSDLTNQYENNSCVRNEINRFININLKWSIQDNLPNGDYEVRIQLMIEKDGEISNIIIKSDYAELNDELKKTLTLFQNQIKFVDQYGISYKYTLSFPINISVR
jgi:hypothetical protein